MKKMLLQVLSVLIASFVIIFLLFVISQHRGTKLQDIKFFVANERGEAVDSVEIEIMDENSNHLITIKTDETGFAVTSLASDDYYYRLKIVPIQYEFTKKIPFTVNLAPESIEIILDDKESSLSFFVEDKRMQGVQSVEIEVTDEESNFLGVIKTDGNGWANKKLPVGNYYYRIVSVPSSYELVTEKTQFSVEPGKENNYRFVLEDKKSVWNFFAVNQFSMVIESVGVEIIDENNNFITTIITDENGCAKTELVPGTYYFRFVSIPEYIGLYTEKVKFEIEPDKDFSHTIVLEDKR